ncbi:MAG: 30S ribosome-binding factor RbfA [Alphaproteobacteria bacterium]|nr:30S ribosome-binding factor RbfA [Alphaproteobacteria bacterium]
MAEKEPSQRQLRVAQEIRKIIAQFIDRGEVRNLEGINTLVTVTKVTVSPDLKYCTVWFITSNGEYIQEVLGGLQLASNYFRKQVAAKTSLRYIPEINFRVDKSFEEVDKIEKLLHNPHVAQDLK